MKMKLMYAVCHLLALLGVALLGAAAAAPATGLAVVLSLAAVMCLVLGVVMNEVVADERRYRRGVLS